VDATWAVVGLDPLRDVLDYLGPRLDVAHLSDRSGVPAEPPDSEGAVRPHHPRILTVG
jgi:hypothetical protein